MKETQLKSYKTKVILTTENNMPRDDFLNNLYIEHTVKFQRDA